MQTTTNGGVNVASRRMLIDTIVLMNYVGEVNDEASYQQTTLKFCYCYMNEGTDINAKGRKANDSAKLYIFDDRTLAYAEDCSLRTYIPYSEWRKLDDKRKYWTISDCGTDYFRKEDSDCKLKITGFARKAEGTRRMWHFEVNGK